MVATNDAVVVLDPFENDRLANLCGQFDEHIRLLERREVARADASREREGFDLEAL